MQSVMLYGMATTNTYDNLFISNAKKYRIDAAVIKSVAITESDLRPNALGDFVESTNKLIRPGSRARLPQSQINEIIDIKKKFNLKNWPTSYGLMQINLPTFNRINKNLNLGLTLDDLLEPATNIKMGTLVLKDKLKKYRNPLRMIIGYNGHFGRFTFAGIRYLKNVLNKYKRLTGITVNVPFPYQDPVFYFIISGIALISFQIFKKD